ncbi:MAG: hypothetical protein J0H73_06390, partial [Salana multivorans]|nr:hypothetical protein [Salana multivorans]
GLAVVNGGGYRQARVTKSMDIEAGLSGTWNGFYAAAGGYYGKRGNDIESIAGTTASSFRTATRIDFMGGYKSSVIGIGGEYFYARDWNNVAINPANFALSQDTASGWSGSPSEKVISYTGAAMSIPAPVSSRVMSTSCHSPLIRVRVARIDASDRRVPRGVA